MITYRELALPKIPKELLIFKNEPISYVKDIGYNLHHEKNGRILKSCEYFNYELDSVLKNWIFENIPGTKKMKSFPFKQVSKTIDGIEGTHIVHSDIDRKFALNYMLELGGKNVITSWYQETDKPLRRTKSSGGKQTDTGSVNYSDLKLLDSVVLKLNTWYLIATDILHDVDNIEDERSSISISFKSIEILKYLNIKDNVV
jgi:hypothetical protein